MTTDELLDFSRSVRGTLSRLWPSARCAGEPHAGIAMLADVWAAGASAGWNDLAVDGGLEAVLVVMHELGRVACPLPVMDTYVAAKLLTDRGDLVEAIGDGSLRPVVVAAAGDHGTTSRFVEAAAASTHAVVLPVTDGPVLLRPIEAYEETPGIARPAWCDVRLARTAAAEISAGSKALDHMRTLIRLGLVVRAMSSAERSHELAVEHARNREQFGRLIGSFQAVQHRTVNAAIDIAAFGGLRDEAVRLERLNDPSWQLAAELAVTYGAAAGPRVQLASQHTLAAVGYFEEHEAPWLYRASHACVSRAATFAPAMGEPADVLIESGERLPRIELGPEAEELRRELREFLHDRVDRASIGGVHDDPVFLADVADRGYLSMGWPSEYGGRDAGLAEQMVISEEFQYHRAPATMARGAAGTLAPPIIRYCTDEQKRRFLPLISNGEFPFYLGYSEPEVGSDLASLRTRAVLDGDEWVVNGAKSWGTGAHRAKWMWLATRTDPEAVPRHAGITVFLAPTELPGWEVQQHRSLSGEISCSTYFDDVRIPDTWRVGPVNEGWKVITSALAAERVVMAGVTGSILRQFDDLLDLVRSDDSTSGPRGSATRRRVSDLAARLQAARVLLSTSVRLSANGNGAGFETPMAKVVSGELAEEFGEAALEILGPAAALSAGVRNVPGGGAFEYNLRMSITYVIGGGTGDIQRNLIARGLGLPTDQTEKPAP